MNQKIYLYVLDTLADWEIGYLNAELHTGRYFRKGLSSFEIITVGLTREPVTTMGGLRIIPDREIGECDFAEAAALILPGADTWAEDCHAPVLSKAKALLNNGSIVAAICGATVGLARAGVLDNRYHTSNDLDYLKAVCPTYRGEQFYQQAPAVTDDNLITASGVAPLDFATHIFRRLDVFAPEGVDAWYHLYTTYEAQYYFQLVSSTQ